MTHRNQGPGDRPVSVPLDPIYVRRRWVAVGVIVVVLITLALLVEAIVGGSGDAKTADDTDTDAAVLRSTAREQTEVARPVTTVGELPPGGAVTATGDRSWKVAGASGSVAGDPDAEETRTVSYVVEIEGGLETSAFGGAESFAAMVDATLADPRSWIGGRDDKIAFRHVGVADSQAPDLRIRLATPDTTRQLCGAEIDVETSCFVGGGDDGGPAGDGRVVINAARWIRGALTFSGDLGSYRQYVLNHEIGHGIGHGSHEACPADGELAPIMMQQTLSLRNRDLVELDAGAEYMDGSVDRNAVCRANAWPHPEG